MTSWRGIKETEDLSFFLTAGYYGGEEEWKAYGPGFWRMRKTAGRNLVIEMRNTNPKMSRSGFSLVEMLAAIAVMLGLIGIVLGIASVVQRKQAEGQAAADIQRIGMAIAEYVAANGEVPNPPAPQANKFPGFLRAWLSKSSYSDPDLRFSDPWGNQYRYGRTGRYSYVLRSAGWDQIYQTEDDIVGDGRK
jgi:prepilin-type N-terminal cleavage/methylation domain-containing protein